jgi:hypothetical protein
MSDLDPHSFGPNFEELVVESGAELFKRTTGLTQPGMFELQLLKLMQAEIMRDNIGVFKSSVLLVAHSQREDELPIRACRLDHFPVAPPVDAGFVAMMGFFYTPEFLAVRFSEGAYTLKLAESRVSYPEMLNHLGMSVSAPNVFS